MADEVTPIPQGQEAAFARWLLQNHVRDLDHPDSHYDYRGAFLSGIGRGADTGHFPDTFKQHGHPTFSTESKYSAGPGDGGSWNGDTFIPERAMTQPVTPWLPGQAPVAGANYGRLALPGVNDGPAPYGMDANHRHVIPDQVNLDGPVKPNDVTLDESPAPKPLLPGAMLGRPSAQPEPQPPPGPASGWRVKDDKGNVVATIGTNPRAGLDYQKLQVQNIGDSLLSQAVSPTDKAAAQRATAYGLSLVGTMSVDKIQKEIVHRYDQDQDNATKRDLQMMRTRNRGGGPGALPGGQTKFGQKLSDDLWGRVNKVVDSDRTSTKYPAIEAQEQSINEIDALLNSNAMGQRTAVQKQLLELTGKASRESEQTAITGAAGKWEEFKNKISQWTSDDPQLTKKYIAEFKGMLAAQRQAVEAAKERIGRSTAQSIYDETDGYPEDQRQAAADAGYGRITGKHSAQYSPPAERPAASAHAAGPAKRGSVDADLLK